MKSVSQDRYGGPEVLKLEDVDQPVLNRNSVLIQVEAVAVTAADVGFRKGQPLAVRFMTGLFSPKRLVLGGFFAGTVHALGSDVKRFAVGDAIFGATPKFLGAMSEFIALPEDAPIVRRPEVLSQDGVPGLAYGFTSAMPMMRDSAKVKAGDNVLILGASGSVGLAAVQIAKYFGARVTGMSSEEKAPVVRSAGAEQILDYRKVDLATCPPTYDVILDASGKASFSRSQSALKPRGVFVAVLPSPSLALEALPKLGRKRISFPMTALRSPKALLSELNLLVDLARSEKLVPIISRYFSLEETQDAHQFIESRQKTGDVVIRVAQGG